MKGEGGIIQAQGGTRCEGGSKAAGDMRGGVCIREGNVREPGGRDMRGGVCIREGNVREPGGRDMRGGGCIREGNTKFFSTCYTSTSTGTTDYMAPNHISDDAFFIHQSASCSTPPLTCCTFALLRRMSGKVDRGELL